MRQGRNKLSCGIILAAGILMSALWSGCRAMPGRAQPRYSSPPPRSFYEPATSKQASAKTQRPALEAAPKQPPATEPKTAWWRPRPADPAPSPAATPPPVAPPAAMDESLTAVYRLKGGDPVVVYLRGIPGVQGGEQIIENIVSDLGEIQLPYINSVSVGGKTVTETQDTIRQAYIDQQIYRHLTVNVVIPSRGYYIRGEVRQPGRYSLVGAVTLLQAVAAAGGYSEFANRRNVEILRGERRIPVNMQTIERNPERDRPVEPGDVIIVHRSFF